MNFELIDEIVLSMWTTHAECVDSKSRTPLSGDYSIGRLDDMSSSAALKAKSDGWLLY